MASGGKQRKSGSAQLPNSQIQKRQKSNSNSLRPSRATAEQRSVDKAKDEAGRSTFDYSIPDNEKDDYIEFMTAAKPLAMHLAKNKISEATKLISLLWGVKSGYVHLTEICKYVEYIRIFLFSIEFSNNVVFVVPRTSKVSSSQRCSTQSLRPTNVQSTTYHYTGQSSQCYTPCPF